MKKLLPCLLAAVLAAAPLARAETTRADLAANLRGSEAILRDFQGDPDTAIPASVLAQAHALVISHQLKAGFIFGARGGYAIVLVKKPGGHWSVPGFFNAGGASFGLQAGAQAIDLVYVITDDATAHNLFQTRFEVGADAAAVAGPHAQDADRSTNLLKTPVLIYSKTAGLYAGVTVKGGFITRDDKASQLFYYTHYALPEILYSDWVSAPAEAQPLMNYVQQIAP